MEKMNSEIKNTERVFRELKPRDIPIPKGYQLYHNYVRTREALKRKTTTDACGIIVERNDMWITLIQNASVRYLL